LSFQAGAAGSSLLTKPKRLCSVGIFQAAAWRCGVASLPLLLAIIGQIRSGATFPIAKFRASQPQAFWAVIGAYALALFIVFVAFLALP
jgi:hypothetical protein